MYRNLPSQDVLLILSGKCISGVPLTWDMAYLQVVPLHDVYPLPDPCIHTSLVWKMTEWSVVRLNHHRVRPLTIVLPLGQSPHYAKELSLIGTVPHLSIIKFPAGKGYWLQAIAEILLQYGTYCRITCVSGYHKLLLEIWKLQDRGCSQCQLQPIKCLMLRCGPAPFHSCFCQLRQRSRHFAEPPYKPPVPTQQPNRPVFSFSPAS